MNLKSLLPWYALIGAKIVLPRLPVPYGLWHRLHLYRHGAMRDYSYASRVFESHVRHCPGGIADRTLLELGPGDSLLTAVFSRIQGASRIILVDNGRFAAEDIAVYRNVAEAEAERLGRSVLTPAKWKSLDDLLSDCHATYLTEGLQSLRTIADHSIDFSFSNAVLDHVRKAEFAETMTHLHRVASPTGYSSHPVDLRDNLGGSLNKLLFSEETWVGPLFSASGFYTNRIRFSAMLYDMTKAGLRTVHVTLKRWLSVPHSRSVLDAAFTACSDDDLRVQGFPVLLSAS
jgi:hypothetical protein